MNQPPLNHPQLNQPVADQQPANQSAELVRSGKPAHRPALTEPELVPE
jgi:hypothetical protein